jgi:hypothetical protein
MTFDFNKMIPELENRIGDFIDDLVSGLTSEADLDEWDFRDHLNENALADTILAAFAPAFQEALEDLIQEKSDRLAAEWEAHYLPLLKDEYEYDGQVDESARRQDWATFIDMKEKDGDISEFLAFHCDFDVESL